MAKKILKQEKLKRQRERASRKKQAKLRKKKESLLNSDRQEYAKKWSNVNASFFAEKGLYTWMATFLENYKNIIEIGTGDGRGTLVLAKSGHKILSIDENPFCLQLANDLLIKYGFNVLLLNREKITFNDSNYSISYEEIGSIDTGNFDVVLIEGDIINDNNLHNWLLATKPYDAIACWLIGTHTSRQYNKQVQYYNINSDQNYRLKNQNIIYEIAEYLLRSGGILHIVDRGEVPDSKLLQDDFLNSHKEQASVTSLEVTRLDWREYEEPNRTEAIQMVVAPPLSGRVPNLEKLALQSITAIKP